jgi:DNA polymerase III delta subunit
MNSKLQNLYLIFGDDLFRLQKELSLLIKGLETEDKKVEQADPAQDLDSTLFGMSLFSSEKLILIDLDQFDSEQINRILDSADQLIESTTLIFVKKGKLDKRLKFYKALEKIAYKVIEVESFSPWKLADIATWVKKQAQDQEIKLDSSAAQRLVECYGPDTAALYAELQKLQCFAGNDKITIAHVNAVCESHSDLFKLVDLLLNNELAELSRQIKELSLSQNPLMLLSGLQTIMRGNLAMKSLQVEGLSSNEIASHLGKNPWKVGQDLNKLTHCKIEFLQQIVKKLNILEEEIKTGICFNPELHLRFGMLSS